jgi:hypothetical protein
MSEISNLGLFCNSAAGDMASPGLNGLKGGSFSRGRINNGVNGVHTISGAHLASYPMCTVCSFFWGKAAGAQNWPLTS